METENNQIIISEDTEETTVDSKTKIGLIIGGIVLLAILVGAIIFLLNSDKTPVIRDIFVILLGFELFVIGFATILLIVQTTRLINMFQHEIKPVLDAANETMSTFRGTAMFISDALVEPVIKLNGYFASIKQAAALVKNFFK
ncbi:hypothetical protein KQH54_01395 [bacterium]|nr:hypothetical protein [bacterium]